MSSPKTTSASEAATGAGAEAAEDFTKDLSLECKPDSPSFVEYELIYNMTSFLEANGAEDVDKKVLRNMAVALTKHLNDSSPGTLQDVTMENPYGVGYRSPCVSLQPYQGSTSPAAQGRSVREFEEQMATLRKENFNLKLRLYFIEESIPGYKQANNTTSEDTLMKQLIDTKVEMEILRKEVQEKQDLLKEAAQGMIQMEKILKESEIKYQHVVEELNQKIQYLEMEREMEKSRINTPAAAGGSQEFNELMERSDLAENLNALQKLHELEGLLKQSDDKLVDFQQQIYSLEELLVKRDETIKEYEEKVKELVFQNNELLETIDTKDAEIANNERFLRGLRSKNADLKADNEKLMVAFKHTQDNFSKEMSNIQTYERQMRDQQDVLSRMQAQQLREELQKHKMDAADKSCMIQDLEEKLKNRDQLYEKARLTIQKLMLSIKNQQVENSRLKNSTQASNVSNNEKEHQTTVGISGLECTGFCRSFSDTEALNDLTSLQKQKYDNIIEQQEVTIKNLKVEVKKKTADLQNLVNKELWEKNREIERLNKILNKTTTSPMSPQTHNVSHGEVNGELQQSFSDVEYTKALQRNKLLQRKVDILIQRLGTERQNDALIAQLQTELKQARLDAETAEKWRRQCADLCQTLSTRLEELAGFLNSLLKHKDVLGVLAVEKRKAMRRAVDRSLDLSKSLNMALSVSGLSMIDQSLAELHNLSDILGDLDIDLENKTFNSHEDIHGQSIEILKAENKALKKELDKRRTADSKKERRSLPLPMMAENRESESEAWSEPDRKVSLARIGLEDHSASLMAKEQPLAAQHNETDSDYSESNSRSFKARSQERIAQLEQQLQQRDQRILEIQCQLVEADNRLKKENLKVLEANQELEQLKKRNEELHNDLIAIGSQEPSNINNESLLLRQIDEKSRSLEKLQEERERLTVESRLAEIQINSLKADMEIVKQTYEEALQQAAEREQQQLNALKQEMQQQLQQTLMEKQQEYEECLQRDYIAKQLYEECSQQLNELQKQYIEAQRTIDCLQENEQELKQTLVESELTSRNLQKQIDESTLRASKAAMERVKALNDKLQLEKRVEELTLEINKHEEQRLQMQQQIDHLEQEQQTLLERLAVLQTKQRSVKADDQNCQSGYTSEEVPLPHSSGANAQSLVAQQRLGEQRIQNSSPDLGIESDAGRVSSVELNSVQRPQLKTVEMSPSSKQLSSTESDEKEGLHDSSTENIKPSNNNNNADANNGQMSIQQLAKKHDCLKVEQENAELRRKLLRTKRAFEDTYEKLRNANQRKAQIEKDIKNQILKTHNVLKNVRSNMENEL
ncbi:centrosomin isoform X1 [Lucilia cuprina]|uniref:centrosomin isoform X1 n=1 Tax=Lucilia cuprina TaxID=7375 RepID=UPI001F059FB9|nr:centrosomin isoform X1 [Lucilia cuprina]